MCSPTATRFKRELALVLGDRDQGEVGGAAADIHHQDQIAQLHALAPVGVALDPGIEGGLRLFEQGEVLIAGLLRGFERQLARHGIERCRHRDQHLLLGEGSVGLLEIPGLAQMLQIAAAGFDRRDFVDALGRAERQQRRGAVHAGMREPRFGRGDQPPGVLRAALLRQPAGHESAVRRPRAAPVVPAGKSALPGR